MNANPEIALDAASVARAVKRIAREINERNGGADSLVLIGIVRRGANLAERIARELKAALGREIPVGTLDISSYRDDGKGAPGDPRLLGRDIPFALDYVGRNVPAPRGQRVYVRLTETDGTDAVVIGDGK